MMVRNARGRRTPRWGQSRKTLGVFALLLASFVGSGCGAAARSDFDLNRGHAEAEDPAREKAIAESFLDAPFGAESDQYRIGEGDDLEIAFFTHPEQNRFVKVRPDGRVTMPYVGDIVAAGRTPMELATTLQASYADVLVSPRVDVIVQKVGARFYVLGNVSIPGEYALERRTDVLQGIARAGGYTGDSKLSSIVLLRRSETEGAFAAILDFRDYVDAQGRAGNIQLKPYDIVWVPRSAISRWDNATRKLFTGLLQAEDVAIKGWSLINFQDVFQRQNF